MTINNSPMRQTMNLMHLVTIWLAFGCGKPDDSKSTENDLKTDLKEITFKGYIQNAFKIEVNNKEYSDVEEYFTNQIDDLTELIEKAGYVGYKHEFIAEIGLEDLWNNMDVYISPKEQRGFLGKASIDNKGGFNINLPAEANDAEYQVRANKRIGLRLSKADEIKNVCYNFSALDKSVSFSYKEKPIILDKFKTSLTKYDCEKKEGKLDLPKAEIVNLIKKGTNKTDVLRLLGNENLYLFSNYFCYKDNKPEAYSSQCQSNNWLENDCECIVGFDSNNKAYYQINISQKYLDIVNW